MPAAITRARVVVRGHVQGVGFRWAARGAALRLGLTGWVRNRPDGSVEALLEGSPDAVERMVDWLRIGPPAARVSGVTRLDEPHTGEFATFSIER